MRTKTVILVEDDSGWQDTLQAVLASTEEFHLAAMCGSVAEARWAFKKDKVDLAIVDLGLPDGSGVEVVGFARQQAAAKEVLVATVSHDERNVFDAICAGASGYILKDQPWDNLREAVVQAAAGDCPMSPRIARLALKLIRSQPPAPQPRCSLRLQPDEICSYNLTEREVEVLQLIAKGCTHVEISRMIGLTSHTVRSYIKTIYRKLDVNSRGEAVYEAMRSGLV